MKVSSHFTTTYPLHTFLRSMSFSRIAIERGVSSSPRASSIVRDQGGPCFSLLARRKLETPLRLPPSFGGAQCCLHCGSRGLSGVASRRQNLRCIPHNPTTHLINLPAAITSTSTSELSKVSTLEFLGHVLTVGFHRRRESAGRIWDGT